MASNFSGTRGKPAVAGAGLTEEARKAFNSAFDALSDWREDMASTYDKNSVHAFETMAAAAKTMGWPSDFVDLTRQQMQQASKLQLQMMDQVMDVWEQQMKSPGAALPVPAAVAEKMKSFQGAGGAPSFPGMPNFPGMPPFGAMPNFPGMPDFSKMAGMGMMNPIQFWMQAAEMWQKSWGDAFKAWSDMQQQAVKQATGGKGPFGTR